MARPAKWQGETKTIRVPAALADKILEMAQLLERGVLSQNPEPLPAKEKTFMIGVQRGAAVRQFIVTGNPEHPGLDEIDALVESRLDELGKDRHQARLMLLACLVEEMEKRGVLRSIA